MVDLGYLPISNNVSSLTTVYWNLQCVSSDFVDDGILDFRSKIRLAPNSGACLASGRKLGMLRAMLWTIVASPLLGGSVPVLWCGIRIGIQWDRSWTSPNNKHKLTQTQKLQFLITSTYLNRVMVTVMAETTGYVQAMTTSTQTCNSVWRVDLTRSVDTCRSQGQACASTIQVS